jgi:hypothetical protein
MMADMDSLGWFALTVTADPLAVMASAVEVA